MLETAARPPPTVDPTLVIILAGVCAALHVGKLPPAIAALQVSKNTMKKVLAMDVLA